MKIAGPEPRYFRRLLAYWPAARAARAALQASDSLSLFVSMQERRSGPVLSAQNFCASSRQAAMPPLAPCGAPAPCAKAPLAVAVSSAAAISIVLIVIVRFLRGCRPTRQV